MLDFGGGSPLHAYTARRFVLFCSLSLLLTEVGSLASSGIAGAHVRSKRISPSYSDHYQVTPSD